MNIVTFCWQIIQDMWAHKLRSTLALFGIVWGTITVIMLLALGRGFYEHAKNEMIDLTDNSFFIIPSITSKNYRGYPKGQLIKVKTTSAMNLQNAVPNINLLTPILITKTKIAHKNEQIRQEIYGVSPDFYLLRKLKLTKKSRFINPIDIKNRARVAVIGNEITERLFKNSKILHGKIYLNGIDFTVIGAMESSFKKKHHDYSNGVIIPYSTYINLFGNQDVFYLFAQLDSAANPKHIEASIRRYFAHKYHFSYKDKTALTVFNTTKIFQFIKYFFIGIQLFLGICGAFTLAVGSLGVTNIMFLIVSERTKEIGIRMAVGASSRQVLLQILLEALVIVAIGGLAGFLFSFIAVSILQTVTLPEWMGNPTISGVSVLTTITILAIFGMLAGYFPAQSAAKLDPVEAINSTS